MKKRDMLSKISASISPTITIVLTESEARALAKISAYSKLDMFKALNKVGHLDDHKDAIISFLEGVNGCIYKELDKIDKARIAIYGWNGRDR